MAWCCGQTYVVNKGVVMPCYKGNCHKSFESFIKWSFLVILMFLLVYACILIFSQETIKGIAKSNRTNATQCKNLTETTRKPTSIQVEHAETEWTTSSRIILEELGKNVEEAQSSIDAKEISREEYISSTNTPTHSGNNEIEWMPSTRDILRELGIIPGVRYKQDYPEHALEEINVETTTQKMDIEQINKSFRQTSTSDDIDGRKSTNSEIYKAASIEMATSTISNFSPGEDIGGEVIRPGASTIYLENVGQNISEINVINGTTMSSRFEETTTQMYTKQSDEKWFKVPTTEAFINEDSLACDNFYQYSCAKLKNRQEGAIEQNILLKAAYADQQVDESIGTFQKFFSKCMEYANDHKISKKANDVLSNHVLMNNLTTILTFLMARQASPLFEVDYDSKSYGWQILPPRDSYPSNVLENWSLRSHIIQKCVNHSDTADCQKKAFEEMVLGFEKLVGSGQMKDVADLYYFYQKGNMNITEKQTLAVKSNISELNKRYPLIDWRVFLSQLSQDSIDQSTPVYLYSKANYFDVLMDDLADKIAKDESKLLRDLKNYYLLQLYANLLTIRNDSHQFCINQASQLLPEIADNIISKYLRSNKQLDELITKVVDELKDEFIKLFEGSQLKNTSKVQLKSTVKSIKVVRFPVHSIENDYKHFSNDYLSYLFRLLEERRMLKWTQSSSNSTINNQTNSNSVVIPNDVVLKLTQNLDSAEAQFRFSLSRAMASLLNLEGRRLEKTFYNKFETTLNDNLKYMYDGRSDFPEVDSTEWAQLLESSNSDRSADTVALQVAIASANQASKKHFFVSIIQDFCQSNLPLSKKFRVDAMIANSEYFESAFRCAKGSPMNLIPDKVRFDKFKPAEDYGVYDYEYESLSRA